MALTKRIDEFALATAEGSHEIPAMLGGVTYKLSVQGIKDYSSFAFAQIYDPTGVQGDAFDYANMHGTLSAVDVEGAVKITGDTMTGPLKLVAPVDPTDAVTKAYVDASGGGATISDIAPATPKVTSFWWQSSTGGLFIRYRDEDATEQWVQVNAAGIGEAPKDNKTYARKNGLWSDVNAILGASYLPLTGGALTGPFYASASGTSINGESTTNGYGVYGSSQGSHGIYGKAFNSAYAGVLGMGYNASVWGALGWQGAYGVYASGPMYCSGALTTGGAAQINGQINLTNVSNFIIGYGNSSGITTGAGIFSILFAGNAIYDWQPGYYYPASNQTLGTSTYRWGQIYSTSSTISTSDETLKQDIRALFESEKRVARALKDLIVMYRMKDAVAEKGNAARIHCGMIAQRIEEAFIAEGLDAHRYGLWCEDELQEKVPEVYRETEVDVFDAEGKSTGEKTVQRELISQATMRGTGEYIYSLRYEELIMFILGGL